MLILFTPGFLFAVFNVPVIYIIVTERSMAFFPTAVSRYMKRKVISIVTNVPTSKVDSGSQFVLTPCKKNSALSASNWDLRCS